MRRMGIELRTEANWIIAKVICNPAYRCRRAQRPTGLFSSDARYNARTNSRIGADSRPEHLANTLDRGLPVGRYEVDVVAVVGAREDPERETPEFAEEQVADVRSGRDAPVRGVDHLVGASKEWRRTVATVALKIFDEWSEHSGLELIQIMNRRRNLRRALYSARALKEAA